MNLEELKSLVAKGESRTLEFKKSTGRLHSAMETICAFLNNKGGIVLIGVNDNGQIIGQEVADNTRQEIASEINKIEPTGPIEISYVLVEKSKFVIVIQVSPGNHVPYVFDGRAYQRHESVTARMTQHRYEQLLVDRGQLNHSWEDVIAVEYTLEDLDHEEIYKTVSDGIRENRIPASAQREDVKQVLERLNLIVGNELKRAAVVLYAKQESVKFLQCMIKMARFKGTNKLGDFIDNQQLYGNSFRILSEADAFLRRHLPIASFFKPDQFKRMDKPALPVLAVREALINAICHRDYSDRSTDISLAVYDDRLEIWNSGTLLKNLTVDNLKHKHESVLRNKLIANAFYVRGWIEKWGSGTNKMIDLCKEDSIPEPSFEEYSGGFSVMFRFKEPISMTRQVVSVEQSLSIRQEEILTVIRAHKSATIQQVIKELKDPPSQRMIQKDLRVLREQGLIDLKGIGKMRRWDLKSGG